MLRLQNADPNDAEAQKQIEEEIRKNLIERNYQSAMENCPEFFGQITMLYIETKVNNNPVQAFVDSGAQSTIISKDCAEQCNIMHLLDTRFAGMAVGVGSSRILGRVHLADLELLLEGGKSQTIQCSFTVLEDNKVDLLFGLDNLKRHQCCIDLVSSKLHVNSGEFSVPFLPDGAIKKRITDSVKAQDLQPAASNSNLDETMKELCNMGFSEAQVREALRVCDGNKDQAANYLLSG